MIRFWLQPAPGEYELHNEYRVLGAVEKSGEHWVATDYTRVDDGGCALRIPFNTPLEAQVALEGCFA
jgi:hypothetical protein